MFNFVKIAEYTYPGTVSAAKILFDLNSQKFYFQDYYGTYTQIVDEEGIVISARKLIKDGATGPAGATGPQGLPGESGPTGPYSDLYYQPEPPTLGQTNAGARWIDSDTGVEYVWTFDGMTYIWLQPAQLGKVQYSTTEVNTSNMMATFVYEYYGVSYTDGICTVTLPFGYSPDNDGKIIIIADEVGGISLEDRGILVQGTGGQLINGNPSLLLKSDYISMSFLYRNGKWKTL
jgi:hypothetical protein